MASPMIEKKASTASAAHSPAFQPAKKHSANNLGLGFEKRHKDRRASSMQIERGGDGSLFLRGNDGQLKEVEVVSTRNRESFFEKACPVLPLCPAVFCALLNVIPGFGTFVAAFLNLCMGREAATSNSCCNADADSWKNSCCQFWTQMLTAFLQLLTAPLIAGIFWSVMYGLNLISKSRDHSSQVELKEKLASVSNE